MVRLPIWGNDDYEITQAFGVPGFRADWYQYSANYGFPAGYHIAVDVGMEDNTPIYAANDGVVEKAGWSDSFRPYPIYIRSDKGPTEVYGHLLVNFVSVGERVKRGQLIGLSGHQTVIGTMERESGSHLHWEVWKDEPGNPSGYQAIDPVAWVQSGDMSTPDLSQTGTNKNGSTQNSGSGDDGGFMKKVETTFGKAMIMLLGIVLVGLGAFAVLRNG